MMFNYKIFVLGIEHSEYGGMSIPPHMQDQGTCNDCYLTLVDCVC